MGLPFENSNVVYIFPSAVRNEPQARRRNNHIRAIEIFRIIPSASGKKGAEL